MLVVVALVSHLTTCCRAGMWAKSEERGLIVRCGGSVARSGQNCTTMQAERRESCRAGCGGMPAGRHSQRWIGPSHQQPQSLSHCSEPGPDSGPHTCTGFRYCIAILSHFPLRQLTSLPGGWSGRAGRLCSAQVVWSEIHFNAIKRQRQSSSLS
jgi:hypothetical protein